MMHVDREVLTVAMALVPGCTREQTVRSASRTRGATREGEGSDDPRCGRQLPGSTARSRGSQWSATAT